MEEKLKKEGKNKNEVVDENENKNKEEKKFNKEKYEKDIQEALDKLSSNEDYLKPGKDGLSRYSPKMEAILEEINKDEKGLVLLYSAYRTVEGLEIFSRVLKA